MVDEGFFLNVVSLETIHVTFVQESISWQAAQTRLIRTNRKNNRNMVYFVVHDEQWKTTMWSVCSGLEDSWYISLCRISMGNVWTIAPKEQSTVIFRLPVKYRVASWDELNSTAYGLILKLSLDWNFFDDVTQNTRFMNLDHSHTTDSSINCSHSSPHQEILFRSGTQLNAKINSELTTFLNALSRILFFYVVAFQYLYSGSITVLQVMQTFTLETKWYLEKSL